MYADDTSISYSSKNIDELNETLNSDLDSLKQWLEGNKLSLNVIKTQAMVIGSRPNIKKISDKLVPTPSFAIGNSHIDVVDNAKYLGVQLDKHLVWGHLFFHGSNDHLVGVRLSDLFSRRKFQ